MVTQHARKYPTFHLRMQTAVTGLIEEGERIVGVRGAIALGRSSSGAALTVGADGRNAPNRLACAGQAPGGGEFGVPIDVLWMRLSRRDGDPEVPAGRFDSGQIFVMLYRGDYWQCASCIPKEGPTGCAARGGRAFRAAHCGPARPSCATGSASRTRSGPNC